MKFLKINRNFNEIGKFLEKYKLPKMAQVIENLNDLITTNKIKLVV